MYRSWVMEKVCRFGADENGNIAMIVGVTIIPILALAGFAIDLQMTTTQKNAVQAAIDSAVIAGSRSMQAGASPEDVTRDVNQYVSALLGDASGGLTCGSAEVTVAEGSEDIVASINCSQKTTLTQLMGKQKMDFNVTSGSTYGVGKVDVAFVFDVSGSMLEDDRIGSLKSAASDAVETLLNGSSGQQGDVRIAMVTYATGVNAGQYYSDVTGLDGPHDVSTEITKVDCTERTADGTCMAGYIVGTPETITSQRADQCTFDRLGNAAFTDVLADDNNPLEPSPTLKLWLDMDRNFLGNGGVNTSRFSYSDYKYRSSDSDWDSTLSSFKFWRDGAGSWSSRIYSREGRHMLELADSSGIISQDVSVEAGKYYNVVFSYRRRPGEGASTSRMRAHWTEASVPLNVTALESSGHFVEITPSSSNSNWQTYHYNVLATSNTMRLSFEGIDGDNTGGLLDDVWVAGAADACPDQEPLPLTDDKDDILDFIDGMEARGGTAGHHGIAWGWYTIAANWADVWPSDSEPYEYGEENVSKAMIVMTDGAFNDTRQPDQGSSSEQAEMYCDNAKAEGVVIFTIAFDAPEEGQEILEYCASGPSRTFQADSKTELEEAYQKIATSIADLRIAF